MGNDRQPWRAVSRNEAQAILTIDLGALAANWRLIAARVAPARCAAVVKADAYGIGIEAAVPALAAAGCTVFFVAHPGEGRRVRACLAGRPECEIYVLNGLLPGRDTLAPYLAHDLRPVLGSLAEFDLWMQVGAARRAAAGNSCRYRNEPARPRTRGGARFGGAPGDGRGRLHGCPVDQPFCSLRRRSRIRSTTGRSPSSTSCVPPFPVLPRALPIPRRSFFRSAPISIWSVPAMPFTAAIRRPARSIRCGRS